MKNSPKVKFFWNYVDIIDNYWSFATTGGMIVMMIKKGIAVLLSAMMFLIWIPAESIEASTKKISNFVLKYNGTEIPTNTKAVLNTDFTVEANEEDIKEMSFTITGTGFTNNIKQLRLVRQRDRKTITILAEDTNKNKNIKFKSETSIEGILTISARKELSRVIKNSNKDHPLVYSSAGIYDIYIDFSDGTVAGTGKMIVKDRPRIIQTNPRDGENFVNPEAFYERFRNEDGTYDEGYYIRATFEDIGNNLELRQGGNNKPLPTGITLYIEGENENFVDQTKELRSIRNGSNHEFTVYIPLTEKLKDGQKYEVFFPERTLVEYKDIATGGNYSYEWGFDTNYFPKTERLYEGSVPEYYDYYYPIVIDGSLFTSLTTVRFQHSDGRWYEPYSVRVRDEETLYVYLPRNRRLPVGTYDIVVTNRDGYEASLVYGVFSVVPEGEYIPNEEYRIKREASMGIIKEMLGTSKDVLDLKSSYSDASILTIDLDEWMGTESWIRELQYRVRSYDRINTLHLASKWVHATLSDVRLQVGADSRDVTLRVGRVEPTVAGAIKPKIIGRSIKSDFIEVSGENFTFSSVTLDIPYVESDGRGLIALRYDEDLRNFYAIDCVVNPLEGTVQIVSSQPGIFVVIE